MSSIEQRRAERRAQTRSSARGDILSAARRVASREGARNLSLRSVATEAGYAPAALYGYFRNKDEMVLALAADDLSAIARAMREAATTATSGTPLNAAAAVAFDFLTRTETLAAASASIAQAGRSDIERQFNGRLIAALTSLSNAAGICAQSREAQADVVLMAAAVTGLAFFQRVGRMEALGISAAEVLARLSALPKGGIH